MCIQFTVNQRIDCNSGTPFWPPGYGTRPTLVFATHHVRVLTVLQMLHRDSTTTTPRAYVQQEEEMHQKQLSPLRSGSLTRPYCPLHLFIDAASRHFLGAAYLSHAQLQCKRDHKTY